VFCNCDDPEWSNFWKYFELNFSFFGLKKLISTHYETDKPSYKLELKRVEDGGDINGDGKIDSFDIVKTPLKQNGDFRSPECIEILKEADIIVTNPPFSLFREYISQLIEYKKKFIVIGNKNAATNDKEIFYQVLEGNIWLGINCPGNFLLPNGEVTKNVNGLCRWFTNLKHSKRNEELVLYKTYKGSESVYEKYDETEVINVDKVKEIPLDYQFNDWLLNGVPVNLIENLEEISMEEIWKEIKDFEGLYQISNLGRVKALERTVEDQDGAYGKRTRQLKERVLISKRKKDGYREIGLSKEGQRYGFLIHRLVADAFLDNPENRPFINHKDENKENNELSNLEWCLSEYNANYGTRNERLKNHSSNSHPILQVDKKGNILAEFNNAYQAAEKIFGMEDLDVSACGIRKCVLGYRKTYKGFVWIKKPSFVMGVPITFLGRWNPNQFEILGIANSARFIDLECKTIINGKKIYDRLLIKRKAK
jgi:hypothetical protein